MAKINISIDDELLKQLDELADENFMSRSGFISASVNEYVKQKQVVKAITSMSISMSKIALNNEIDEETRKELEAFQRICNSLNFNK